MKECIVTILPRNMTIFAPEGAVLLSVLREYNIAPDAPCGGNGSCGKCRVCVNGNVVLACRTAVTDSITVTLINDTGKEQILTAGVDSRTNLSPVHPGAYHLAFDIGTTTLACSLLDGLTGEELATASMHNPQRSFGADVISRIHHALHGAQDTLSQSIRSGMAVLTETACQKVGASPSQIGVVAVVGNPCMQQLFLGIMPQNLATAPFFPVLTDIDIVDAGQYLPLCPNAKLLIIPDISGYVGADTVACLLATRHYAQERIHLLIDIGTNGEMVLGNRERMIVCSTAAGPALEGANILFGMRGKAGAIDQVWLENGKVRCHVIGDIPASGICGSGLIDAVALMLDSEAMNDRGRIQIPETVPQMAAYLGEKAGQRVFYLTETVYLTQQDIREVQLAKGAIATGVELMANHAHISLEEISSVQLAGAFGSAICASSAIRIGLIPQELLGKVTAIGNAALSGAKMLALNQEELYKSESIVRQIEYIDLASMEEFQETFVENMLFP